MSSSRVPGPLSQSRLTRRRAVATAGAGAVAAAFHGRAHAQSATPEAAAAPTPGLTTPEGIAEAVRQAPEVAKSLMERTGVPGMSVVIAHEDHVLFIDGFGVRELGKSDPVEPETVFQVASLSKALSSTVVSALVGQGSVAWASRMADLDPSFALHDAWPTSQATLTDLFSHRSGLRDHAGDVLEDLGFDVDDIIHRLRYLEPQYSFRAGYEYTNFGLSTAAYAAAKAVGKDWNRVAADVLYEPLGMASTSSRFRDYMAQPNRAVPHSPLGPGWPGGAADWQVAPLQRDPDAQTPAGGVSSNAVDMARWLLLQLGAGTIDGKELIPAAALAPTHTPQAVTRPAKDPATGQASFYGLGFNVNYNDFGLPVLGHSGAFALGAATCVEMLPASRFGVVALTNASPVGLPEAFCLSILDLARTGTISTDWLAVVTPSFQNIAAPTYGTDIPAAPPSPATPAQPNAAYVGTYANDYYGDATISETADGLALGIANAAHDFALAHFDRDTFTWQPIGENAYGPSALSFTLGPDGTATGFSDQYLGAYGPGTLPKKPTP